MKYTESIPVPSRGRLFAIGTSLFVLALVMRLCFWQATPDSAWSYSAYYKGDAPTWIAYADALESGAEFEMGLPLRPPGMAYLLSALWDGDEASVWRLKLVWCFLGALIPPLCFLALFRRIGAAAALMAGALMALSTGLMMLSTSLNNETPYLVLVTAGFALLDPLARRPRFSLLILWAALTGIACLVRVEHVLFFALCLPWLFVAWRRRPHVRGFRSLGWLALSAVVGFSLPVIPWHVSAWSAIAAFNEEGYSGPQFSPEMIHRIEGATSHLVWDTAAGDARAAWPAFGRDFWSAFVSATVLYRGGTTVTLAEIDILEDAFGSRPERLSAHPFVTLYGPLNFFLANSSGATEGFSRDALEIPPRLKGGAERYPAALVTGLPPEDKLLLIYPPHLEIVNRGYALGWRWIVENPGTFLSLAGKRLGTFWSGAAMGATGYGFPLDVAGLRRRVDLTVADGGGALLWRLTVLSICVLGLFAARGIAGLAPWLLFFVSKLVTVAFFFGYARIGATVIPVVCLLAALACVYKGWRPLVARRPGLKKPLAIAGAALVLVAVAGEAYRLSNPPTLYVRGREVVDVDPYPVGLYLDQRINVRY